ncbi:MAG TPA: MaoC/PaaZ C-terminal domain-containing protein [Rhodoblastus sp.]|nr:MaoC/PaaZ C-terminal domain-containing protein [Rhodoblastus sp.]
MLSIREALRRAAVATPRKIGFGMGYHFEDFEIGKTYVSPRRTVIDADIMLFAGLTGDFNPIHTDDIYASGTNFGQRIAHGPMLVGMAFGLASRTGMFDGTVLGLLEIGWTFQGAVKPGDTVHVRAEVLGKRPTAKPDRGVVHLQLDVLNQTDKLVQRGKASVMFKCRPPG